MGKRDNPAPPQSQHPPDWFGWLAVAALFLLPAARLWSGAGVSRDIPLLSLGEWLLLPLGVASLAMGLLPPGRWVAAVAPAVLWLAAACVSMIHNGIGTQGGDILLSWAVRLIFPAPVFLPLLNMPVWRDRLMRALAGGVAVNAVAVFWQARVSGAVPPDTAMLRSGGFLASQHEYGLMLALALPLIVAWRGGERSSGAAPNKALATLFCTFLLPVLALSACFGWAGLAASAIGLLAAWAAWREYAWILGIFVCLLLFGYGSEAREGRYRPQRRLLAESAMMGGDSYRRAFEVFQTSPFLGAGPESFAAGAGDEHADAVDGARPAPWYASLLGGTGLFGLGMWLALLGELTARATGRRGGRCLWQGGILGGAFALAVAGLWTDALPEGAGALVGVLLAASMLAEQEPETPSRTASRITTASNC
ncbi:MAG: hypothetical protein LBS30_07475 [Planctomycetota bacterium]|jgi:hypothetical protein|nr:hypothetical protein [Planctomycetota bacterium]